MFTFFQVSRYTLAYPVMLFGLVAPKLKEVSVSRNDHHDKQCTPSPSPSPQPVDSQDPAPSQRLAPAQIVDEITQRVLSGMPLRFIDLTTGTFCSSAELLHVFKRSPEYQTLVSDNSLTPHELVDQADDVTRKFFAYVMLSHVWGEDEPLYGDVQLIPNVLEMSPSTPGTLKLQKFCCIARQRGFRWCWSDTCCIDKSSSAELQESINTMFTWYRNSALTVAFLFDVLESTPDALKCSRWFTRGWTLQELLAPHAMEFYKGDWTPFIVPSAGHAAPLNYKLVPEFVQCLEAIHGIDKSHLVHFSPGLNDVREKLGWMATRRTTKVEDMAYCLLGILDLRLPILYGEGERAFIRLQDEIMKNTDDTGIFDWVGKPCSLNSYLAQSTSCFRQATWRLSPCHEKAGMSMYAAVDEFAHKISAALLRLAESLLAEPPLGHFIANGRMNLRVFVYEVRSVELTATTEVRKQRIYTYNVKAECLEPVTVVTTYKFPDTHTARSLSIGRVWDNALRVIPTHKIRKTVGELSDDPASPSDEYNPWSLKNDDYLSILADRLREPFVAQLLVAHPNGEFRRVSTEDRIVAQPRLADLLDLRAPRTLIVH